MGIFIIYMIGIIKPFSCFDYIYFKVSLVIKIINFNGIQKITHLVMLVIFHVNVIITSLLKKFNFQISHMVFEHGSI
jgi:hypothetical protein